LPLVPQQEAAASQPHGRKLLKSPRIFYGYWIVAASASIQGMAVGTYVTFGVFFGPVLAEFGWSRAILSGAHSVAFLIAGMLGILVGRLSDRFGPRLLMTVSACFCGLSLALMSQMTAPWQLYLFYGVLFGIGLSAVDVIALSTTARWFLRRRGAMTGLVKMGTGFGQFAMPLAAGFLIAAFGWRTSYLILGVTAAAVLLMVAQLLRRDPAQMGLLPDAEVRIDAVARGSSEAGSPSREALKSRAFWTIFFANLSAVFAFMIIMLHIVPHATDIGIPRPAAASILSAIGAASIAGRFLVGHGIDRIGNRRAMIFCCLLLLAVLLWLQVAGELWMLYVFAAAYGLAHGGFFTAISPIVAEYFGLRSHGLLFGLAVFAGTVGGFFGPILAGYVFDLTSSYRLAFWICLGSAALALGLLLSLRPVKAASAV
jgi:MFS family permease